MLCVCPYTREADLFVAIQILIAAGIDDSMIVPALASFPGAASAARNILVQGRGTVEPKNRGDTLHKTD
jgi:hypothetical protein